MKIISNIAPHIKGPKTTQKIMLDVIIALMPALAASVFIFGWRALMLTAFSAAFCVVCEWAWEKLMHKPVTIGDLSAVVTGILIAFNVPSGMPLWELMVGDICAIIGVKMLFGGIGCNFMNPALVGRIVMMFSFTTDMTTYAPVAGGLDVISSATPLTVITQLDLSSIKTLFLGFHPGVLGETSAWALLIGGVYLLLRKVIKPAIPFSYLISVFVFGWIFGISQGWTATTALLSLLSGGVLLGAFFMATDYVTSPFTTSGKVIFGIGCGFFTALIRVFGNYAEGVTFAILLMNLVVPYINDLTLTKPFGGVANEGK